MKTIHSAAVDYFYVGKKTRSSQPMLSFRSFVRLRVKLKQGHYDLVAVSLFGLSGPVWRRDRGVASNLLKIGKCLCGHFYAFGVEMVPWLLRDIDVPLIVIDRKDDPEKIPAHFFGLLRRCRSYFWRELPVKLENGFTFATTYMEDTSSVRKAEIFTQNRHKILPLALSVPWKQAYASIPSAADKEIDVFFAGTVKGSRVRDEGFRILEELRMEGLRVIAVPENIFSEKEYIARCSKAWLVWSPEGHGWDCYRHYEACLAGTVPVMNYPRTWRYRPLIHERHGWYYGPEGGDLKRVIRKALADKEKLTRMARLGREHVLEYHLADKVFSYVLAEARTPQ